MGAWLLVLLLAAPPASVIWHFPGPEGAEVRKAVLAAGAADLPGHHVTAESIDALLRGAGWPASLGCLDDASPCDDPTVAGLGLVGATARLDARARREGDTWRVTLAHLPTGGGRPEPWEGRGPTLEAAAAAAVAALRGTGTLRIAVTPPGARLFVDDKPLGQGAGDYPVAPGEHRIRAEAPGHLPSEQPVRVSLEQVAGLTFELRPAMGRLRLRVHPAHAKTTLDGVPVAGDADAFEVTPGRHAIRAEAEGYETYDQSVEVPAGGEARVEVELGAPGGLLSGLPPPDPDALAHGYYVRAGLRIGSLEKGQIDEGRGSGNTRAQVTSVKEGHTLVGLDLAVGWRGRVFLIEALGLTFAASTNDVDARLNDVGEDGEVQDLSRVVVRPAWVGVRYPVGRFEPFLLGGVELVLESFDVDAPSTTPLLSEGEIDHRIFLFGLEAGLRYHFTDNWFGSASIAFELFPDERGTTSAVVGAGYALELPEGL